MSLFMGLKTNANNQNIVPSVNMKPTPFPVLLYCGTLMEALLQCLINSCSCILMRIASWPLYRDAYRIVTLLAIHSPSEKVGWICLVLYFLHSLQLQHIPSLTSVNALFTDFVVFFT